MLFRSEEVLAQQLTQQMSSVYSDDAALVAEEVLAQQLSQQVRRGQAHRQQAAVSAIRDIHNLVLERPQSPQPSGGFNKCSSTAWAQARALCPYRGRLVLVGVMLFQVACNTTFT